jgi:DNA-binding response OmpR family regulator
MKILIIDDDISTTVTLKALLMSKDDFEVDTANSGEDALKILETTSYDLLILDVMMPGFSGRDFCQELSKDEKIKNIPIIIASALPIASKELEEMMIEFKSLANIKGVLEKPFPLEDLLEEIKKV